MIPYEAAQDRWKLCWSEQGTRQNVHFPLSNRKALAMAVHMRDRIKTLGMMENDDASFVVKW